MHTSYVIFEFALAPECIIVLVLLQHRHPNKIMNTKNRIPKQSHKRRDS